MSGIAMLAVDPLGPVGHGVGYLLSGFAFHRCHQVCVWRVWRLGEHPRLFVVFFEFFQRCFLAPLVSCWGRLLL